MSQAAMDFTKHEIKSYPNTTKQGSLLSLSDCVTVNVLSLIVCYCGFHQQTGRSEKDIKTFDKKFLRRNTKTLCGIAVVAARLQLNDLLCMSCDALSLKFNGKTSMEIREIFLTQEDLSMEKILMHMNSQEKTVEEERSIDDILSFINGKNKETGGCKKNKKKNKRRKDKAKDPPENVNQNHDAKDNNYDAGIEAANAMKEYYDGLDPAIMEKIGREVEEFEWRVNLDKYERMKITLPNKKLCY